MMEWISVENFRGISRTPEPLPLSKFTVLIGLNGSGKSALLEALYMLPPAGSLPLINYERTDAIISNHLALSGLFYRYGDHATLRMGVGGSRIEIELLERPMGVVPPPEFYRLDEGHFARMNPGWQEAARALDIDPGELSSYSILVTGGDDWRRRIAQGLTTTSSGTRSRGAEYTRGWSGTSYGAGRSPKSSRRCCSLRTACASGARGAIAHST
jgi:Predicted ATPases